MKRHFVFWVLIYLLLILLYGNAFESYLYSIYFVTILFPVVFGAAYFFNFHLVPKFLMTGRRGKFVLYFIYTVIVSAHLQIIMIFLAFIYLANYQVNAMHPSILDVSKLSITLYAVVFGQGFLLLLKKFQGSESKVVELKREQEKSTEKFLVIRSDRQQKKINHNEIAYIESLSDYIKIHLISESSPVISKAKISRIAEELPAQFLRIHRSYLVNLNHVTAFEAEQVAVNNHILPVSRSYKNEVRAKLNPVK